MGRQWLAVLVAVALGSGACSPAPSTTERLGGACAEDLPPRSSPTRFPVAILHVAGDDLPPVLGEIEWLGGDDPVATAAPRAVHLERFTVFQVRDAAEISLRMTDGVSIAGWRVTAIADTEFRAGDVASGVEWSAGDEVSDLVCVPIVDGAWAIRADLRFAEDGGRGTFYWRLNVAGSPNG